MAAPTNHTEEITMSTITDTTAVRHQIIAQLTQLVDGYLAANEAEGDGAPSTWDFVLATYHTLAGRTDDDAQDMIDVNAPVTIETDDEDATDQASQTITVGDEVEITDGDFSDRYGRVVAVDRESGTVEVWLDAVDEDPETVVITTFPVECVAVA